VSAEYITGVATGSLYTLFLVGVAWLAVSVRKERADTRASDADFEKNIAPYRLHEIVSHRKPREPKALPAALSAPGRQWAELDNNPHRWPGNEPSQLAAPVMGSAPVNQPLEDWAPVASAVLRGDTGLIPAVKDAGRPS
jgi:hypothetical protein